MFTAIISGYRFLYLQLAALVGYGWAIVALSFICSFLMLPLMRAVAGIVRREKEYEDVIDPQVVAIKAKYASDMDRHFHIQRLYQRYGYSPLAPIKKVLPLFVQIPFLLLTYYMLKGTAQLSGVSFLFLRDLGTADALLPHAVNLFPLVMTGVNILTVFATPGFSHKDWTQAIAISLLFLVLLYTAPSALLLYWTLNNVISFTKVLVPDRFAGARLLSSRMVQLLNLRAWLRKYGTKRTLAGGTLVFGAFALYLGFMAKMMYHFEFSSFSSLCFRGMNFALAAAAIGSFLLLWRDVQARRSLVVLSTLACLGYAGGLMTLYLLSREWFLEFCVRVNLFMIFSGLFVLWMLPCVFRRDMPVDLCLRDMGRTLKSEICLFALPVMFAVHYAFASEDFSLQAGALLLLIVYLVLPCVVVPSAFIVLFRSWIRPVTVFRFVFAILVGMYVMPMLSTQTGFWSFEHGSVARLLVLMVLAIGFVSFAGRKVVRVFSVALLIVLSIHAVMKDKGAESMSGPVTEPSGSLTGVLNGVKCRKTNNVYFMIFDSYAHEEILKGVGLYDPLVPNFLKECGFTLYDAYSTGSGTVSSMSAAFTLGGVAGYSVRSTIAGDNVFSDFLREAGYTTDYLLCSYTMPNRGERMPGRSYFPTTERMTRPELVLLPCILRGSLSQSPQAFNEYTHEEWMAHLQSVIHRMGPQKSFVYAHSSLPEHAPWFKKFRKSDAEEIDSYGVRLKQANDEIMADARQLTEHDKDSIVIFASDHGPSLLIPEISGNYDARHVLDHHGVLLAIRWPRDYQPCLELNCLQNVLLEVMIYLSGDTSLKRFASEGETKAMEMPIGTPRGLVKNGLYQFGPLKGEKIFTAAQKAFAQRGIK